MPHGSLAGGRDTTCLRPAAEAAMRGQTYSDLPFMTTVAAVCSQVQ